MQAMCEPCARILTLRINLEVGILFKGEFQSYFDVVTALAYRTLSCLSMTCVGVVSN